MQLSDGKEQKRSAEHLTLLLPSVLISSIGCSTLVEPMSPHHSTHLLLLAELLDNLSLSLASQPTVAWEELKSLLDIVSVPAIDHAATALKPVLILVRIAVTMPVADTRA